MTSFKTIVISDVHLGTNGAKAKELLRFLKYHTCERLILNGDIIDGWQLQRSGKWKKKHTRLISLLLKRVHKEDMVVVYTRGNHDDFLDQVIPFELGNFSIVKDYAFESFGKQYYVVHGDVFDVVTTKMKFIALMGDWGYTLLLRLNAWYNSRRVRKGLPYDSLSQRIKGKVKTAVSFISTFEHDLALLAKHKGYDAVICGHIHHACIREIDGIQYMNSGDWVESLTALAEDHQGNWQILSYHDFLKSEINVKALANSMSDVKPVIVAS
jgi:UDP-2,3-diacylglucosamine pyrophosphatase LpxH